MGQRNTKKKMTTKYVELGTINYINLSDDLKHGSYEVAVEEARRQGKPIFANFVEWSGWQGCKRAGSIFCDPGIKRAAEELFIPCAFNTWDRRDPSRNQAMIKWGAGLSHSWWGYLRIIDSEGENVISATSQILGADHLNEVRDVMREALSKLSIDIPDYLL